jgi:hypothetical protein
MTPDPESRAAYLSSSPPGFADWWRAAYGEEEFTDNGQREVFVAAALAWEGALEFAERLVGTLIAVDPDPAPHVVTG